MDKRKNVPMDLEYKSGLVSVLIPAYNHENYVQKAVKSIIEQTYKNIEIIIIDDGSKDKTFEKRIRVPTEEKITFSYEIDVSEFKELPQELKNTVKIDIKETDNENN